MDNRPNIIIFNPDEMRLDAMSHMGLNPAAITPNLDSFAKTDAVSFSNAYCQNPVCVPSRCAMFTGLYPHVHGHRTMAHLLRAGEDSIFSELKNQGYYVWMNGRNDLVSGNSEELVESHASEIYWGGNSKQAPGRKNDQARPGNKYYLTQFGGELDTDENGLNYSSDDEDVDALIRRIRDRPKGQPFLGFVGLAYPHCPYQVEDPYFSAIDRAKIPARINENDCKGKSFIAELIRRNMDLSDMSEEDWRELRAVYLGMCMKVDAQFGRLISGLKASDEYENSLIIFISDHGDFTGDYGLPEKAQNTFEDCLTRVPFIVKPPKGYNVDPGISNSIVESFDLYATIHDYAKTTSSHTFFARSVRPVIENRNAEIREFATCEGGRLPDETHCNEFLQSSGQGVPTSKFSPYYSRHLAQTDDRAHSKALMIRTKTEKYISRINGEDEFYDLEKDPCEMVNLFGSEDVAGKIASLQLKAFKWLQATSDVVPFDADNRLTQRMIWEKVKTLVPPEHEPEIKKMISDGINRFALADFCKRNYCNNN